MKKRRIAAICLVLALTASEFLGCSGKKAVEDTPAEEVSAEKEEDKEASETEEKTEESDSESTVAEIDNSAATTDQTESSASQDQAQTASAEQKANTQTKEKTSAQSGTDTGGASSTNNQTDTENNANTKTSSHEHNWRAVTMPILHEAETHTEMQKQTVSERTTAFRCNGCGYTVSTAQEIRDHINEWVQRYQEGDEPPYCNSFTTIHPVVEVEKEVPVTVTDKEAYIEDKVLYYECTICGEQKEP